MKKTFLINQFKSHYCKIVFFFSLFIGYKMIPKTLFFNKFALGLSFLFILSFALSLTCLTRIVKERVKQATLYKTSLFSIISTVIGVTALQACGIGVPFCGASVGAGLIGLIFPKIIVLFLKEYAIYLLVLSIISQMFSLYLMNCFKRK